MVNRISALSAVLACSLLYTSQALGFAREFSQDKKPGVFHSEKSNAKLCLFVYRRQGMLMIQPHCMVSVSSHSQTTQTRVSEKR